MPESALSDLLDEARGNAKLVDGEWPGSALRDWYDLTEAAMGPSYRVYVDGDGEMYLGDE